VKVVAFDTETDLIRPAKLAPPLVCVTWQTAGGPPRIIHHADPACERLVREWLEDPDVLLVGHNVTYDLAVVEERFPSLATLIDEAYHHDRVTDTQIRQWLLDTASGVFRGRFVGRGKWIDHKYDLETLAKRCADIELEKDEWRLSYGRFLDVPLERWPERARQVQDEARARLAQLEATTDEDDKDGQKRIAGIRAMLSADPSRCTSYPLDDARATLAVYLAQERHAVPYLRTQYEETRAYDWLHRSSAWGLRTDAPGVEALFRETKAEHEELTEELILAGLVRPNGKANTKAAKARMLAVCLEKGLPIPRTEAHEKCPEEADDPDDPAFCRDHIGLGAEPCEASEDPILISYAERATCTKVLGNDLKALATGTIYPVHTRYGWADTCRTTSAKPPIQNLCKRPGIREAYVARPGTLIAQCDYPTLELYTLAESCLEWIGHSKLADTLNAGKDPHLWVASIMLGKSYEWCAENKKDPIVKRARDQAKPADFGFPGGMSSDTLIASTRKQMAHEREAFASLGLHECTCGNRACRETLTGEALTKAKSAKKQLDHITRAEQIKGHWLQAFPEMREWFRIAREKINEATKKGVVEVPFEGHIRGGASYCAVCNTPFQGLGARCAKRAGWLLRREQYVNRGTALWGTRTVAFVHDEFLLEVPADDRAHDAAQRLADVMCEGANQYLRRVPIPRSKMDPLLMRRWSKKAEACFDDRGRLVPWAA
jgi:hypothetical protein